MGHPHFYDVKPRRLPSAWDLILVEGLQEPLEKWQNWPGIHRLDWKIYQGLDNCVDPTRGSLGLDLLAKAQFILDTALLWALKHGHTRLCPHRPGWLWRHRAFVAFDVEFHRSRIACGPSHHLERCDITYCGVWPLHASQCARVWCRYRHEQASEYMFWFLSHIRLWNATDLHCQNQESPRRVDGWEHESVWLNARRSCRGLRQRPKFTVCQQASYGSAHAVARAKHFKSDEGK